MSAMVPSMQPSHITDAAPENALWVFAYGSLMWNPGFAYAERQRATLHGVHRALCIYSTHYRGTQSCPGLVMGLDRGGSCHGFAFRVPAAQVAETRSYLAARELITHVYKEVLRPLRLEDGRRVEALCYVADPSHPQYAGRLTREEILRLIRQGCGDAGPCCEYVLNTLDAIADLGIKDHSLNWLGAALRPS